jgi:PRTRC genetic system protein A
VAFLFGACAMFNNLVTYYIYKSAPLPANDALAYQYILANNGIFIRTETYLFEAILLITTCTIRGLASLQPHFRLKVSRIPARLLDSILTDARRARRSDGSLNEVLYHFHHHEQLVQVKKPVQQTTATSVKAAARNNPAILCDLHSHGNMPAYFSPTDNADEQAARLYAVVGRLDSEPEIRLRVGVYGYWQPLPVTAVFTSSASFKDLYQETPQS